MSLLGHMPASYRSMSSDDLSIITIVIVIIIESMFVVCLLFNLPWKPAAH